MHQLQMSTKSTWTIKLFNDHKGIQFHQEEWRHRVTIALSNVPVHYDITMILGIMNMHT